MYIPLKYQVDSNDKQAELIKKYPLGTIITTSDDGEIVANHIPFICDRDSEGNITALRAHFARANDQVVHLRTGKECLVIFKAPDAYVSPSWYKDTKPETAKVVPTWAYSTVHVYGKPKVHEDDEGWLHEQMNNLTDSQEAHRAKPWKVDDAPENYLRLKKKRVHGLSIEVTKVQGKWKLDQEKKGGDLQGVIDGLKDDTGVQGEIMSNTLKSLIKE